MQKVSLSLIDQANIFAIVKKFVNLNKRHNILPFEMSVEMKDVIKRTSINSQNVIFRMLMLCLLNDEYKEFLEHLDAYLARNTSQGIKLEMVRFLHAAVSVGRLEVVQELLNREVDINAEFERCNLVQLACRKGHHEVLNYLLNHNDIRISKEDSLLCVVLKVWGKIAKNTPDYCNYSKCFDLLLMECPDLDINQMDSMNCRPLFYALKFRNEYAVKELLQRSAYIGKTSETDVNVLRAINPEVLEHYLDSCLTTNGYNWYEPSYEIHIDFTCLVSPNTETLTLEIWPKKVKFHEDIIPIEYIAHTPELEHLLKHPVISSFLYLKWYQFQWNYWIGVSIEYSCFLFCVLTSSLYLGMRSYFVDYVFIYRILLFLQVATHSFICILNIWRESLPYFHSFKHCTQISLFGLMWILVFFRDIPESNNRPIYSLFIMLSATNFYSLFCAMPYLSISIHAHMFRTVTSNFLGSLIFFFVYFVAFAFSFHLLFAEDVPADASFANSAERSRYELHSFSNIGLSFLKTVVMLTGEYEAAEMKFNHIVSYFIFVLFIFVISITLLNLLNGLAVSDIQAIKRDAELINLKQQSILLCDYERKFNHRNHDFDFCKKILIKVWLMTTSCLFSDLIQSNKIKIFPNHPKLLIIAELAQQEEKRVHKTLKIRMDPNIIQFSKCCIERKRQQESVDAEKKHVNDRLKSIVAKVEHIESTRGEVLEQLRVIEEKMEADKKVQNERWRQLDTKLNAIIKRS